MTQKLYRLENGLGSFWVIATDPTTAESKLTDILNKGDYGYRADREVKSIHLIAQGVDDTRFLTGKRLII
jgi:hypothetical protein